MPHDHAVSATVVPYVCYAARITAIDALPGHHAGHHADGHAPLFTCSSPARLYGVRWSRAASRAAALISSASPHSSYLRSDYHHDTSI